ncbi:MAG: pelota family protein [Euryarchaeota archaeon]|nr:pelota family protein [Euryarchaeota archaeon]
MQLLKQSEEHWKLRIDSEDDLWVLARFAISGRSLAMLGERRDTTTAESGGRAKAAERKKMWIQLRIITMEYKTYSSILRVHGTIEQAPMDIGSHHTHLVEVGDEIELHSLSGFPEYDRLLLTETMTSDKKSNVSIIVVENDEIVLFEVTRRGLREGATWTMRGGGKRGDIRTSETVAKSFQQKVAKEILAATSTKLPMILCGPGHARERLRQVILAQDPQRTIRLVSTSMAGRPGANEIIREGLADELLSEHAISKEIQLLEEVWLRLSKNGAVAYGENELSKAMNEGAIETLLVSADTLRNPEAMIDGTPVSTWIQGISDIGAELVQCSSDHDSGEQLNNMGGVIALLRYRLV